jgi:hypothetical protein
MAYHAFTKLSIFILEPYTCICIHMYTYATLKPIPLVHINIKCTWISELITKLSPNGFMLYSCVSYSFLTYTY